MVSDSSSIYTVCQDTPASADTVLASALFMHSVQAPHGRVCEAGKTLAALCTMCHVASLRKYSSGVGESARSGVAQRHVVPQMRWKVVLTERSDSLSKFGCHPFVHCLSMLCLVVLVLPALRQHDLCVQVHGRWAVLANGLPTLSRMPGGLLLVRFPRVLDINVVAIDALLRLLGHFFPILCVECAVSQQDSLVALVSRQCKLALNI